MPSTLVINHHVALQGSKELSGVLSHTVSYIGTREGVVYEPTQDDIFRQESGFLDYVSERPGVVIEGTCGLFDAEGATNVAETRRAIEASGSAVVTSVVSVRREDGPELRLATRQDFERYLRSEWAPAMALAMGIPEERIGWFAAFHLNSAESYHAHVITYDREGRFNHILDKCRMEEARQTLTDAAIAPQLRELAHERTLTRDECVGILRELDTSSLANKIQLPTEGSLKYEWIKRQHPEIAKRVERAVEQRIEQIPQLKEAQACFERSVGHAADLKGLEGQEKELYMQNAVEDLKARQCNALLHAFRPDRAPVPRKHVVHDPRPPIPSQERKLTARMREELGALPAKEKTILIRDISKGHTPSLQTLKKCPSWKQAVSQAPAVADELTHLVGSASYAISRTMTSSQKKQHHGTGAETAEKTLDLMARLMVRATFLVSSKLGKTVQLTQSASHILGMAID